MNHRVPSNCRYQPTEYEHAANCATHAVSPCPHPRARWDGAQFSMDPLRNFKEHLEMPMFSPAAESLRAVVRQMDTEQWDALPPSSLGSWRACPLLSLTMSPAKLPAVGLVEQEYFAQLHENSVFHSRDGDRNPMGLPIQAVPTSGFPLGAGSSHSES